MRAVGISATIERDLSDEEVDFFQENGWVFVPGLISRPAASRILGGLRAQMGDHGYELTASQETVNAQGKNYRTLKVSSTLILPRPMRKDEYLRSVALSEVAGRNVARLLGREVSVRLFSESGTCKVPSTLGGSGSAETLPHQDHPTLPTDRSGEVTIWLALTPLTPEMGTMRFLSGSHRESDLGRMYRQVDGRSVFEIYPRLLSTYSFSEPLSYEPGDATFHAGSTIHLAPQNLSDETRWAYLRQYIAGDTLFTGAPYLTSDLENGLRVNEPFDTPNFPLVYDPAAG